jgi:hypothetical protein
MNGEQGNLADLAGTAAAAAATPAPALPAVDVAQGSSSASAPVPRPWPIPGPDAGLPIPDHYGHDRVVLMVQDPHHLFAYWEFAGDRLGSVRADAGAEAAAVLVLLGDDGQEQREIDLAGGKYFLSVAPGRTYRVQVALRTRSGQVIPLATSNAVTTPAAAPSAVRDETWMAVDETFDDLIGRAGLPGMGGSSLGRLAITPATLAITTWQDSTETGPLAGSSGILSAQRLAGFMPVDERALATWLAESLSSHSLSSHSLGSHSLGSAGLVREDTPARTSGPEFQAQAPPWWMAYEAPAGADQVGSPAPPSVAAPHDAIAAHDVFAGPDDASAAPTIPGHENFVGAAALAAPYDDITAHDMFAPPGDSHAALSAPLHAAPDVGGLAAAHAFPAQDPPGRTANPGGDDDEAPAFPETLLVVVSDTSDDVVARPEKPAPVAAAIRPATPAPAPARAPVAPISARYAHPAYRSARPEPTQHSGPSRAAEAAMTDPHTVPASAPDLLAADELASQVRNAMAALAQHRAALAGDHARLRADHDALAARSAAREQEHAAAIAQAETAAAAQRQALEVERAAHDATRAAAEARQREHAAALAALSAAKEQEAARAETHARDLDQTRSQLAAVEAAQRESAAREGALAAERAQAQARAGQLARDLDQLRADHAANQAALADTQAGARARAAEHAQTLMRLSQDAERAKADHAAAIALAEARASQGGERQGALAAEQRALHAQNTQLARDLAQSRADHAATLAQANEAAARHAVLIDEHNALAERAADLAHQGERLVQELGRVRLEGERSRALISDLHERRAALEAEREQVRTQLGQCQEHGQGLAAELARVRQEWDLEKAKTARTNAMHAQFAGEVARLIGPEDSTLATALTAPESEASPADRTWRLRQALTLLERRRSEAQATAGRRASEVSDRDARLAEERAHADAMRATHQQQLAQAQQAAAARVAELETALAALAAVRDERAALIRRQREIDARVATLETANRELAIAVASAVPGDDGTPTDLASGREDFIALIGEETPDHAAIAAQAKRLAVVHVSHQRSLTETSRQARAQADSATTRMAAAEQEASNLRATLESRDIEVRRTQVELTLLRREIAEQAAALTAQQQELAQSRDHHAALGADHSLARERVNELEKRAARLQQAAEASAQELAQVRAALADAKTRAHAAEAAQVRLAQSFGDIHAEHGSETGDAQSATATSGDGILHAISVFVSAQTFGGDVGAASRDLVEAVQTRNKDLADELAAARERLLSARMTEAQLLRELQSAQGALAASEAQVVGARAELSAAHEAQEHLRIQLGELQREATGAQARERVAAERLRQIEAELDGIVAREQAARDGQAEELAAARAELSVRIEAIRRTEQALQEARERHEAGDARLKRQREEFERMLAERDRLIRDRDQQLDELGGHRAEAKGLAVQVKSLTAQLETANARLKDQEGVYGAHASASTKSGDLAGELRKVQADRDSLREKQRILESELADTTSATADLRTQLDEKRKEVVAIREQVVRSMADDREKAAVMREEFRKLKEEVIGLRARLRRLSDGGPQKA